MDEQELLNQLDSSNLQSVLGNSDTPLIPESLVTTITVGFIVMNVLGLLFLVVYVLGIIRKWKVQSAVLHMRKDLAEIKAHLVPPVTEPEPVTVESVPQQVATDQPGTESEQPSSSDSL